MVFNPYAVGRKVYGNGSYAAHSGGGLDPSGYVERELKNQNKDSQQRSGLADAALQRLATSHGGTSTGNTGAQNPGYQPFHPDSTSSGGTVIGKPQYDKSKATTKYKGKGKGFLNKTARGRLKLKFDSDIRAERSASLGEYLRNQGYIAEQKNRLGKDYLQARRDYDKYQAETKLGTLNNFGGRGLVNSSGYGHAVTQNATEFNKDQSQMAQNYWRQRRDINIARNEYKQQFEDLLRRLAVLQTRRKQGKA